MAVLLGAAGDAGGIVVLVASLPLLWAWGLFQAHVAMNPVLDEVDRRRWRIAIFLLPWSMTAYWHLYVRSSRAPEK